MPIAPVTWSRSLTPGRRAAAAVVTGFVVALTTHIVVLVVFFTANGAASTNIVPISDFFLPVSLVLFVLVAIAAALGVTRTWYASLIAGFVAGVLAPVVGTIIGILGKGTAFSADVFSAVLGTLIGNNLIVIITATLVTLFVGRRVWARWNSFSYSSTPIALIRQPSSRLAEGEVTHIQRKPIDSDLADEQWDAYVEALEAAGFETVEVPTADHLPDSVFIEDAVVVFGGTAVITSPGAESRRPETHEVQVAVKKLGLAVREITLPGTLDGGDVLQVASTVYVGRGGRTNAEGIRQLRAIVAPLGYSIVAVPVSKALHLKSAVTALPDGTVVGSAKVVDNPALFDRFLPLPEHGAAVVVLSDDTVLMADSTPKSIALIEDLGYTVVTVDISEFEKLEGCVTCLSVRIS
jgi:dimethylargininase